jgi:hypothetical protein
MSVYKDFMCCEEITVRLVSLKMVSMDGVENRVLFGTHSLVRKCWLINGDLGKSDWYRHHLV